MARKTLFPDFYIIGAPKCGTTSLYEYLKTHPQIFMPSHKEPHYFSTDIKTPGEIKTEKDYLKLFSSAGEKQIIGEASVKYLYSNEAIKNILKVKPEAKFVMLLRDPVSMFLSLHQQFLYSAEEDVLDPIKAWKLSEKRRNNQNVPLGCSDHKILDYKKFCSLGGQLERFIRLTQADNRKIIFFEDFIRTPRETYINVLQFLGVKDDGKSDFPVVNERKEFTSPLVHKTLKYSKIFLSPISKQIKKHIPQAPRSFLKPLYDRFSKKQNKPSISSSFENELREYFISDIKKIEDLLDRDLSHWKKSAGF